MQALPPGRVVGNIFNFFLTNYAGTTVGNPVVTIELFFDCGIVRKVIPVQYLPGTSNSVFGDDGAIAVNKQE